MMKTTIVALLITLLFMTVNYISYRKDGHLRLCHHMFGGEITVETGFGLEAVTTYAMSPEERDTRSLRFSFLNFLLSFVIVWIGVYLCFLIIDKILDLLN